MASEEAIKGVVDKTRNQRRKRIEASENEYDCQFE